MKTTVNYLKRSLSVSLALLFFSTLAFAGGEITEVFLTGTNSTAAGDFVAQATDDIYQYRGV